MKFQGGNDKPNELFRKNLDLKCHIQTLSIIFKVERF